MAGAVMTGIGAAGSLYSGYKQGKELSRQRALEEQAMAEERGRRQKIENLVFSPDNAALIAGQTPTSMKLEQETQKGLALDEARRAMDERTRALKALGAQKGMYQGAQPTTQEAPAWTGLIQGEEARNREMLSSLAKQIALFNSQQKREASRYAQGQAVSALGSMGVMPTGTSFAPAYAQAGQDYSQALGTGLSWLREGLTPRNAAAPAVATASPYPAPLGTMSYNRQDLAPGAEPWR